MKFKGLLASAVMAFAVLAGCETKEDLGTPKVSIDQTVLEFDKEGGSQTIEIIATRDWEVETDQTWVVVDPDHGSASAEKQTVTVTVLENTGLDRTADLKFTIGMASKTLKVSQSGPEGSAEALILYANDFDKEVATKTYGSNASSWPYLDQFEGWKNQTGTGAANVDYTFNGMSARANSTSSSDYSDYEGSGNNNMFFGKEAYLAVHNINLGTVKDITLSFGSEKYTQSGDSFFKNEEFHVYLSADSKKWVELDYVYAGTEGGRWNVASATFSVPAGTAALSVCVKADMASVYRMDDLKLAVASAAGTAIDFTKGVEMDFTAGGSTGGGNVTPENIIDVTVAEFLAKPASTTQWYRLSGEVGGAINTQFGNFDLSDGTATVYVYGISNWSEYSSKFAAGDKVTIVGQRYVYTNAETGATKDEVMEAYIESWTSGGGASGGPDVKYYIYKKAAAVTSGKSYIMVAGTNAATPISGNYGYINVTGVTADNDEIVTSNANAYEFTAVDGGYTIKQSDGRYLYMTGTYNSFNLAATPSAGHVWSIAFEGGAAVITNNEMSKSIQFDPEYNSFGSYPDVRGTYPVLYEQTVETEAPETGGNTGGDVEIDPNATVITLDASSKLCDTFPEGSTGVQETKTYTIGGYEFTFSPSSGNKFSWYTDGYVLWGKTGAYILFPAVEGKALTRVTILTGKNASTSVKVGVYDEAGTTAATGGEAITLNAKNTEFSYNLTGTAAGAKYQLRVMNDKNAQFQKLTLVYE